MLIINKIQTQTEYDAALGRLKQIWDSKNPQDRKEFEQLVNLIEEYENIECPI